MRLSELLRPKDKASAIPAHAVLPAHVAVIMDGNGRWAKARNLPRTAGHKKGAESLRTVLNACRDAGVKHLTIYAFSSENWRRPADEINDLMQLLVQYLNGELAELHANNIRLRFIGDMDMLSAEVRKPMDTALDLTRNNTAFHFTIALSYGSRQELTRAVRKLAKQVQEGKLIASEITEAHIEAMLDTAGLPEPDLLIRTGGEQRLSNFLLWQSAYTEFYFTPTLWPDFGTEQFHAALDAFANRQRRFGTTGE